MTFPSPCRRNIKWRSGRLLKMNDCSFMTVCAFGMRVPLGVCFLLQNMEFGLRRFREAFSLQHFSV